MMLSFRMAIRSISSNKMRAMLTMLGIIIGVMALVVLVSFVSGATTSVTDTISGLGSNLLTVTIEDDKGMPVSMDTLKEWAESLGLLAPYISDSLTGSAKGESGTFTVYGTTPDYYEIQGPQLVMGRFLKQSDLNNQTYACIINETAAEELIGYVDCVGQAISLNGVKYTVVGVLQDDEKNLTSVFSSGSLVAYVSYGSLQRLSTTAVSDITTFYVSAAEGKTTEDPQTAMTKLLMERFELDEDAFEVSSQDALEDTMSSITSMMTVMHGGIAAISLVIGGIGIMMVTVTERTREIGIRKAIGASRGTILTQFLMEAVVLYIMPTMIRRKRKRHLPQQHPLENNQETIF